MYALVFIAKWGNASEEIKYVSWVLCGKRKEKHLVKHFAFLKNVKICVSRNILFFYELLIGPRPTFLECIVISCHPIGQLCLGNPS